MRIEDDKANAEEPKEFWGGAYGLEQWIIKLMLDGKEI